MAELLRFPGRVLAGVSASERATLEQLLERLISRAELDSELYRRAQWLLWYLQGHDPTAVIWSVR
jgi:hypothetical protein